MWKVAFVRQMGVQRSIHGTFCALIEYLDQKKISLGVGAKLKD